MRRSLKHVRAHRHDTDIDTDMDTDIDSDMDTDTDMDTDIDTPRLFPQDKASAVFAGF